MGKEDNGGMGFQQNCPSSGVDPFYGSGWDPMLSLNHGENFCGSGVVPPPPPPPPQHSEFASSHFQAALQQQNQHLAHYQQPDSGLKIPSFGGGAFSEMVNSFGLPECETSFHPNPSSQVPEDRVLGSSPNGKKKRKAPDSHSPLNPKKSVEEQHRDASGNSSDGSKEHKMEQSTSANLGSKQAGKQQVKESSNNSGDPSKEAYIHVRAKRGQATNSHSLAERVRRERISERMRLLQELVPGCNKITGKAVMLDEIINYVQSLQQQVEFLSMKLATVNPELNIDIERIFSKDILQSRGSNAPNLGLGPGMNSSLPFPGYPQGPFPGIPGATPPFQHLPQAMWDNELQNLLQMGFDSNPSMSNLGPNGPSKLEL